MFEFIHNHRYFPPSVKTGFRFLIAGWAVFYLALYIILQNAIPLKLLVIGPLMLLTILKVVNWARMLCLMCNAMVILYALFFMVLFKTDPIKFTSLLIAVILFATASYYLLVPASSQFFKTFGKREEGEAEGSDPEA